MLSPSIHSVWPPRRLDSFTLEEDIKKCLSNNNKRKSLVLQLIRDGNTHSFLNAMKLSEPVEYKKVIEESIVDKCSRQELIDLCTNKLLAVSGGPAPPTRNLIPVIPMSHSRETNKTSIRVMQWNILSEALGNHFDRFDTSTPEDLKWSRRKWRTSLEVLQYCPLDVICMQEVDCFDHLIDIFGRLGYGGIFVPKPDSPCNYIENNIGPDGCAIFWKLNRLKLLKYSKRVLRVYKYQTNQVALCTTFEHMPSGRYFCVATTHLKARKGPILSAFRNEQGKDLLKYLEKKSKSHPLILCGDFNADPTEAVYKTISTKLNSVYKEALKEEPVFTTWTKRQSEKEMKRTLDYIFYSKSEFELSAVLSLNCPSLTTPIPNREYPSDHLSLVAHLDFATE